MNSFTCSDKQTHLAHCLQEFVPKGAKLALCFDPEGDLDNVDSVVDNTGRIWQLLTYRENDLAFRLAIRELETTGWNADAPILLRVAMPEFVPLDHQIELSFIGDLLNRVEGQPIDLRTDAVITFHTETTWPETLQEHADRIKQDIKSFVDAYRRMREIISRERPLGRHHISATLLMARYPELSYRDLELSQAYPAEVIARFLALAATHQFEAEDEQLLLEVLQATAHLSEAKQLIPWREFPSEECLVLLVLTDFLEQYGIQNVALSLSGLGLFSRVGDPLPLLNQVLAYLKERADLWQRIVERADQELSSDHAEKATTLLKPIISPDRWIALIDDSTPRSVTLALLLVYLDDRLASADVPTLALPETIPAWAESWMNEWEVPHHDAPAEARAATLLRMLSRIAEIQRCLMTPLPEIADVAPLAEAYVKGGDFRLELLLDLARKDADVIGDEVRLERFQFFFTELELRIRKRLQALDTLAGELIRPDVQAYLQHPRSTIHFLKPLGSRVRQGGKRLFVWLFDGMRYDTWTEVIRPLLSQSFAITEEKLLLAPLPTYTQFARKALFAGGYPHTTWKGFGGRSTLDEQILAARNFGVTSDREMTQETVFVDHADTDAGKEKLRKLKIRRFNCLVFNISDDNLHAERGDLREINDKIRHKVARDVLPEMKRLVSAGDLVVVTSDHGFVELDDQQGILVRDDEAETSVFYRYLHNREHPAGIMVPYSGKKGVESVTVVVGRAWFNREKGRYTRYAHGGASLPEMVVPGVVLHKLEAPEELRLEISTPNRLNVQEDEEFTVPVTIKNAGTRLVTIRVTIGKRSGKTVTLSRGAEHRFTENITAELDLKFVLVIVEAKESEGRYATVKGGSRQIPVTVKERTDKVEFGKALDVFDTLE